MKRILLIIFLIFSQKSIAQDVFDSIDNKDQQYSEDVFNLIETSNLTESKKGKIIVLNKITANSKEFEIQVGSQITYGKAVIELHKCSSKNSKESLLLVSLTVKESDDVNKNIFRGWVFSNDISLSSIEHPVYQLIAVSCV